ncbi:BofC C-terminal domain-containing protein [Anaerovirgula multivorans]|uniref:BofC C-terminal domain-containing protein n=1 Tax=Anaerovirgula multivorans TaxID=312168 RepID=A0A239DRI5_9FIRM|nr:BofC C-terminal domain-containing protein [Anaerovirgula multivorans]SNS34184.1 BofC C-terminal domain-containing protein [Anaerovirgula multivorans]
MYRRRNRFPFKILFFVMAFSFVLVGFFIGYYRMGPSHEEEIPFVNENENIDDRDEEMLSQEDLIPLEDENNTSVTSLQDSIGQETKIIYKTFYTECENTIEEVLTPISSMIGLNEEGFTEYLQRNNLLFSVESFSNDEVVLIQSKNAICPQHYNHYLITEKDGNIAIYHINNRGDKILIETTSIPVSILPQVDQLKLQKGILRKTKEEAYQLLEDYSS